MAEPAPAAPVDTPPAEPPAAPATPPAAAPAATPPATPPAAAPADTPPATPPAEPPAPVEFKLPDGVQMDPRVSDALKGLAAEQGWDSETAQKIADIGVQWQQANQAAVAEQVKGWTESSKADSEFGGAQFDANLAKANTVLDTYATPEFVALLRETGLANHPEMIRTFHKLAAALSEDNLVNGNPPPPAPKDPTKVMYPTMNKTQ